MEEDAHSFQLLRPSSPGPPLSLFLSAELSAIIKVDSSGLSLGNHNVPSRFDFFSTSTPSSANPPTSRPNGNLVEESKWSSTLGLSLDLTHKPSPSHSDPYHPYSHPQSLLHEPEPDLDLNSSHITAQVLDALGSTRGVWGEVVVIDADAQDADGEGRLTHSTNANGELTVIGRKMDLGLERLLNSGSSRQREREWDREKRRSTESTGKKRRQPLFYRLHRLEGKKPSFLPRLQHNSLSSSSSPLPPLFSTPQTLTSAGSTNMPFLPPTPTVRGTELLASYTWNISPSFPCTGAIPAPFSPPPRTTFSFTITSAFTFSSAQPLPVAHNHNPQRQYTPRISHLSRTGG